MLLIFSWSELFKSDVGDQVLVLFEWEGKPLGIEVGPPALISGKDIRTGPRHVKWLQSESPSDRRVIAVVTCI